jgi:hypothetical protein
MLIENHIFVMTKLKLVCLDCLIPAPLLGTQ